MATTTTSLPAAPARRPRTALVGAMLGSGAAFMTYIGLLAVYLIERSNASLAGADWFPEGVVELGPSGWIFWTMIMSIFTVQWAEWSIKTGDRSNGLWALGLTGLFAAAVFNQLWFIINDTGFTLAGSTPEFMFFILNGAFIVFLIGAAVFLALTMLRALFGQYGTRQADGVGAAAMFWNTVCTMYFITWYVVYVTK